MNHGDIIILSLIIAFVVVSVVGIMHIETQRDIVAKSIDKPVDILTNNSTNKPVDDPIDDVIIDTTDDLITDNPIGELINNLTDKDVRIPAGVDINN